METNTKIRQEIKKPTLNDIDKYKTILHFG